MDALARRCKWIGVMLAAGAIGLIFGPRANEAQQAPPRMEYDYVKSASLDKIYDLTRNGWEIVQVSPIEYIKNGNSTSTSNYVIIVRRPAR